MNRSVGRFQLAGGVFGFFFLLYYVNGGCAAERVSGCRRNEFAIAVIPQHDHIISAYTHVTLVIGTEVNSPGYSDWKHRTRVDIVDKSLFW